MWFSISPTLLIRPPCGNDLIRTKLGEVHKNPFYICKLIVIWQHLSWQRWSFILFCIVTIYGAKGGISVSVWESWRWCLSMIMMATVYLLTCALVSGCLGMIMTMVTPIKALWRLWLWLFAHLPSSANINSNNFCHKYLLLEIMKGLKKIRFFGDWKINQSPTWKYYIRPIMVHCSSNVPFYCLSSQPDICASVPSMFYFQCKYKKAAPAFP